MCKNHNLLRLSNNNNNTQSQSHILFNKKNIQSIIGDLKQRRDEVSEMIDDADKMIESNGVLSKTFDPKDPRKYYEYAYALRTTGCHSIQDKYIEEKKKKTIINSPANYESIFVYQMNKKSFWQFNDHTKKYLCSRECFYNKDSSTLLFFFFFFLLKIEEVVVLLSN